MSDPFSGRKRVRQIEVEESPFAERCRDARAAAGMTQEDAARATKMCRTTICNLELGRQLPSMRGFVKLCEAYDVSADWLLWGD